MRPLAHCFFALSLVVFAYAAVAEERDRSPVDLVLGPQEQWLLSVNQSSDSVSLVDIASGRVLDEVSVGRRPATIALFPNGAEALVASTDAETVTRIAIKGNKLEAKATWKVGGAPVGVAVAPDGKTAYVACSRTAEVAFLDLQAGKETARIPVGRWPRYLALTPDGGRLAVGVNGEGGVAVVDTAARKTLFVEDFVGLNLGQMQISQDGKHVYFPWIVYRRNPINASNIKRGWVIASRIARVRLDKQARREAIALDPEGKAVGDPHGLALSPDEQWIACAASGTHELLVYKNQNPGLPFQDYGGPGDHIDRDLLHDFERFYRVPLGGRPMAVRFGSSGKTVYVANYLDNSIQLVDLGNRALARTIPLGGAKEPSLARKGEAVFYDATRSLDQWYSCHSCHYEAGPNSVVMDTRNDGSFFSFKTVPSLRHVTKTGPWTWHGWQKEARAAMEKSLTETMLGTPPQPPDIDALLAYFETLAAPATERRSLSEQAHRGEEVYRSAKAGCATCHRGPFLTDGRIHDVGTNGKDDRYEGYNTPSLIGVSERALYLHDGRSESLEALLDGPHRPSLITGMGDLSKEELADLIAYLKTL